MELVNELLIRSGGWAAKHLSSITLALVATLLVIYGDLINGFVKRLLRPYHRLVRILGFVLMCAFGYGLLTVILTPILASWLSYIDTKWLCVLVVAVFLLVGWLAEKKQQL